MRSRRVHFYPHRIGHCTRCGQTGILHLVEPDFATLVADDLCAVCVNASVERGNLVRVSRRADGTASR